MSSDVVSVWEGTSNVINDDCDPNGYVSIKGLTEKLVSCFLLWLLLMILSSQNY